ncbi:hypothetical protein [Nakamurella endophytica]|uniref:hypothetical protein n=1 Tax=Nakamurella endophytica TaxID=1748367 RepID=UPI001667A7F0|nr:hypothetical protein [Nakamurella endophytica]
MTGDRVGMGRRALGGAVLTAVLCIAVALPGLIGRHVTGTPALPAPPPAAAPDRCVDTAPPGAGPDGPEYPSTQIPGVTVGACDAGVWGRFVTVLPDTSASLLLSPDLWVRDVDACASAQAPAAGSVRRDGALTWYPAVTGQLHLVGPAALARAAGQVWLACLLTTRSGRPFDPRAAGGTVPFDWAAPAEFGDCYLGGPRVAGVRPPSCVEQHRGQVLARGTFDPTAATAPDVRRSCQRQAARLLGADDPTRDGRLVIAAVRDPDVPEEGAVLCTATTADSRTLVGTLIGLGSQPLPYG